MSTSSTPNRHVAKSPGSVGGRFRATERAGVDVDLEGIEAPSQLFSASQSSDYDRSWESVEVGQFGHNDGLAYRVVGVNDKGTEATVQYEDGSVQVARRAPERPPAPEQVVPANLTEARAALRRRDVDVDLSYEATKNLEGEIEVRGALEGEPRTIWSRSGFHTLRVLDGRVKVIADSSFGNPVRVGDGAQAEVFAEEGRKVSVTVESGGSAHVELSRGSRGHQHVEAGGTLTLGGVEAGQRVTVNDKNFDGTVWSGESLDLIRERYARAE